MAFSKKNLFVIDNSFLGTNNGCLPAEYGRFDTKNNAPLAHDIVHLGRKGLRLFCMNIKRSIRNKGRNQTGDVFQVEPRPRRNASSRGTAPARGSARGFDRGGGQYQTTAVRRSSSSRDGTRSSPRNSVAGTISSPNHGGNRFSLLEDHHD